MKKIIKAIKEANFILISASKNSAACRASEKKNVYTFEGPPGELFSISTNEGSETDKEIKNEFLKA